MSYDISIYPKPFLKKAIEQSLGDWSNGDPICEKIIASIVTEIQSYGFTQDDVDPGFAAFMKEEREELGREYTIETESLLAQASVFRGSVNFSIPFSDKADRAIEFCRTIAKQIADKHNLGFYDPQIGETLYWNNRHQQDDSGQLRSLVPRSLRGTSLRSTKGNLNDYH